MAQAGAEQQSPVQEGERTFGGSLTPADRSHSSSPAPSPLRYPTSLRASTNDLDDTLDLTKRLQLNTSPRDLNMDYNLGQTNSPLSAQSYSSQSSFGAPFKASASSGHTSGTSSTHSSLGRNKLPEQSPSTASLLKSEQSLSAGGPLFSYQRPGSALSIHSYTSSRSESPAPALQHDQDHRFDSTDDLDSALRDKGSSSNGAEWNSRSESTIHELRRSRSPSLSGLDSLDTGLSRPQTNEGPKNKQNAQPNNSHPGTPGNKLSPLDAYPASVKVDLIVPEPQPKQQVQQAQQASIPPIGRSRSRSTVAPSSMGMVRARTEAWMNQAQSATSPPPKAPGSQFIIPGRTSGFGNENRNVSSFNASLKHSNVNLLDKDVKDPKGTVAALEAEPSRPTLHRHGRQRSNTVGEAISFPSVKVDNPLTSPAQQRAAGSIPEGHCHKCFERVTENGIRLQNGDRYHIGCFLCNGCKQVFTESEFHIVYGRPYHPNVRLLFYIVCILLSTYPCACI